LFARFVGHLVSSSCREQEKQSIQAEPASRVSLIQPLDITRTDMKVQVFAFSKPYFSLTWKIEESEISSTISNWLSRNPEIEIETIKHNSVPSFWYPTQLFVFIYYK
jgi:hypothetical protein